jgi:hypothetical protein
VKRVFILSPARTTGKRAQLLFNPGASFDLAVRLREQGGVPLGEVFEFLSGLYFRGKLAYAERFAAPPRGVEKCYVITSDSGLTPCDAPVTLEDLRRYSATAIDPADQRYREPLAASAAAVEQRLPRGSQIVLLGSIATGKYVDVLHQCFGRRLVFPKEFVGRGDMSRGGLLLRCVQAGTELEYAALGDVGSRTGKRPPKLTPVPRNTREVGDR